MDIFDRYFWFVHIIRTICSPTKQSSKFNQRASARKIRFNFQFNAIFSLLLLLHLDSAQNHSANIKFHLATTAFFLITSHNFFVNSIRFDFPIGISITRFAFFSCIMAIDSSKRERKMRNWFKWNQIGFQSSVHPWLIQYFHLWTHKIYMWNCSYVWRSDGHQCHFSFDADSGKHVPTTAAAHSILFFFFFHISISFSSVAARSIL